jgi:hypothetical protein
MLAQMHRVLQPEEAPHNDTNKGTADCHQDDDEWTMCEGNVLFGFPCNSQCACGGRSDMLPTLKFMVVMANLLTIC